MSRSFGVASLLRGGWRRSCWVAGWDQLTREQLLVVVAEQAVQIQALTGQIQALTGQVTELTRQLGQNSGNSSMPPSTDRGRGPSRQRRNSTRKPGKQPGAAGSTLAIVTERGILKPRSERKPEE